MDRLPQHVRAIGPHESSHLDAIHHRIEARSGLGFGADGIDAGVRAAAVGQLLDAIIDVFLLEIERQGAGSLRKREPLRHGIDGDDAFCPEQKRALDCELTDRTATPDRDGLTTLQIAEVRGHVAGWEDVGKKQHLFVAEAFGDLDRSNVRIRYAQIFGLSAGEPSQHMRIAEQARWRMSP